MYAYICVDIYVNIHTAPQGDQRLMSPGFDIGPVQVLIQVVCVREREYIYIHDIYIHMHIYKSIRVYICAAPDGERWGAGVETHFQEI